MAQRYVPGQHSECIRIFWRARLDSDAMRAVRFGMACSMARVCGLGRLVGCSVAPCAQDMDNEMQVHAAVQTRLGEIVKAQGSHRDVANDPQFSLCRLLPTPFYTAMKATCLKNGWHLESMFLCVANALEPLRGARLVAVCPCRSSQPTSSSVGFWFR